MYTLVTTTFNDIDGLKILHDSIVKSSIQPNEFIIIDSNSTDNTESYVESIVKTSNFKISYYKQKMTIGVARNFGVEISKDKFILISDTYCILDKNWAKKIINKLKEGYSFVGGDYKVIGESCSQKGYGLLVSKKNKTFNPSSRSIGFKRNDFIEVGGYPTEHNQGEDSKFNSIIKNSGKSYIQLNDAIVHWYGRESFLDLFKQYKRYAEGDFEYRIFKKKLIVFFFLNPIINIIFLLIPFIIYLIMITAILIIRGKITFCSLTARLVIDWATTVAVNNYLIKKLLK